MIGIIGAGESGTNAALLARKMNLEVFVSDFGKIESTHKDLLIENKIPFEEGGHSFEILVKADLIVKSPGVPDISAIIRKLKDSSVEVIAELEFAYRYARDKIIAITGTNGKTTTTNLVHHLLASGGLKVEKGGNLGRSFSNLVYSDLDVEYYVLEVSSFQLDGIVQFHPAYAMILNITPDHLDRYDGNFDSYVSSKFRICENQRDEDMLFYREGDVVVEGFLDHNPTKMKKIAIREDGHLFSDLKLDNIFLRGRHNAVNASFAIALARELSCSEPAIEKGLLSFRNDDHRMQFVGRIDGIDWINDSKATNVESAYEALNSCASPVIWIAGGTDKGNDYSSLRAIVREKVKTIICIGVDNRKIVEFFANDVNKIMETKDLNKMIELARREAEEGDVVLLSPACASFDIYKNYEDRGHQFMQAVWNQLN